MIKSRILFHITNYLFHNSRKSIFVHIPKTAGNSVSALLSSRKFLCIGHDLRDKKYKFPKDIAWFHDLYSCCFVRNPWDRLVSSYHYLKSGGNSELDMIDFECYFSKFNSFEDLVKNWDDSFYDQIHMKPQSAWVFDNKNDNVFNFIGKYENLQADVNKIMVSRNMIPRYVKMSYQSNRTHYKDYYSKITAKIVEEIYQQDIENFNYSFD